MAVRHAVLVLLTGLEIHVFKSTNFACKYIVAGWLISNNWVDGRICSLVIFSVLLARHWRCGCLSRWCFDNFSAMVFTGVACVSFVRFRFVLTSVVFDAGFAWSRALLFRCMLFVGCFELWIIRYVLSLRSFFSDLALWEVYARNPMMFMPHVRIKSCSR